MNRKALLMIVVSLLALSTGCVGDETTDDQPEPRDDRVKYHGNMTTVEYPVSGGSLTAVILWDDEIVCYTYGAGAGAGPSCLPFEDTQVDEVYE